jgi:hypothetical protein
MSEAAQPRGRSSAASNYFVLFLLIAVLVGVHFIVAADPNATRSAAQAAVFSWQGVAITALIGVIGTFFLGMTPLPGMWPKGMSFGRKVVWPVLAGLVLGAAEVATDMQTGWGATMAHQMKLPSIHIPWPLSVPLYVGGAILVSIIYFLLVIPLVTWLVSGKLLKGKGLETTYWLAALPMALVEPLTQGDFTAVNTGGAPAALFAAEDTLLNLAQVWFFRRAGFVAAVLVRVAFYGVWHIGWGWWRQKGG